MIHKKFNFKFTAVIELNMQNDTIFITNNSTDFRFLEVIALNIFNDTSYSSPK